MTPSRLPLSAALTTAANVVAISAGGIQAVLIAAKFGASAQTDGYFAALGVYAAAVVFAGSWRMAIVARLTESDTRFGAFDRYCGALVIMCVLLGLVFVGLGRPLASALTGGLPSIARDTARDALLILWPAACAQLVAGLAASMLAVLDDYVQAAIAYPAGVILMIGVFLGLEPAIGVNAIPTALLAASILTAAMLVAALVRRGWRPSHTMLTDVGANFRATWVLVFSSLSLVALQLVGLISIAAASRVGEGAITIWNYAFVGHGVVKALTTLSTPIIIAAPLAATWDRRPATLRPYQEDVVRTTFVLLIPAVAAVALLGNEVGDALLAKFSAHDIDLLVNTFLVLSIAIATSQAGTVSNVALLTLGRYGVMALVSLPVVVLHLGLSVGAAAIGTLAAVAVAQVLTYTARSATLAALVHGRDWVRVAVGVVVDFAYVALPGAACFGLAARVVSGGAIADATAFAVGLCLYATVIAFMPRYRNLATRLLRSMRRGQAAGTAEQEPAPV